MKNKNTKITKKFHKTICFYFQVHQPYRIKDRSIFEEGDDFFSGPHGGKNHEIFEKVANKCYLPATETLLNMLKSHPDFRVSFSLSGVFLQQCLEFGEIGEKVLNQFKKLVATKQVELLAETYYHSLTFLFSKQDYAEQIIAHRKLIKKLFNVNTRIFRNTELIYNNEIATFIKKMGFSGMLLEGWDPILEGRPRHSVMKPVGHAGLHPEDEAVALKYAINKEKKDFGLLLKDYKLSDDIAFRFGDKSWKEYPMTVQKFVDWLEPVLGDTINLFMDFETFGEHQWEDTGIFEFLKALPEEVLKRGYGFATPSETLNMYKIKGEVDCHNHLSWADLERDLSAWMGNPLQNSAIESISAMEKYIHQLKSKKDKDSKALVNSWRMMQISDHYYYMCLKYWQDGDVHKYFSPFDSPYDAYIAFMNVFNALKEKVKTKIKQLNKMKNAKSSRSKQR